MANKNFKLFGGCLGNGVTLYNSAVTKDGDYVTIGHISKGGRIQFYISNPDEYIPAEDMNTIKKWAEENKKKFLETWDKYPDLERYEILLDEIPYTVLLKDPFKEALKNTRDLHTKVKLLEAIYFENFV